MDATPTLVLLIALISLSLGLLFFWQQRQLGNTASRLSWFFLGIFAAIVFFHFLQSTASGKIMGISVGGPAALFLATWLAGMKYGSKGSDSVPAQKKNLPINEKKVLEWRLQRHPAKAIGLITGDMVNVREADVWVNSENTHMLMARYYDNSVSGLIRYYGAQRGPTGEVDEDTIALELQRQMNGQSQVNGGIALMTTAGGLAEFQVKKVVHVATVTGQVGKGYRLIKNFPTCVTSALARVDAEKDTALQRILVPFFGTGTANQDKKEVIQQLIDTALLYFQNAPDTVIQTIYFNAYRQDEFDISRKYLSQHAELRQ